MGLVPRGHPRCPRPGFPVVPRRGLARPTTGWPESSPPVLPRGSPSRLPGGTPWPTPPWPPPPRALPLPTVPGYHVHRWSEGRGVVGRPAVEIERTISPPICSPMAFYSRVRNGRRSSSGLKVRSGWCWAFCKLWGVNSPAACIPPWVGSTDRAGNHILPPGHKRRCVTDLEASSAVDFQNVGHPKRIHFLGLVHLRTEANGRGRRFHPISARNTPIA